MNINIISQIALFLMLSMLFLNQNSQASAQSSVINKVVIDAGHGGKDPGTSINNDKEKDIVLNVALRLGQLIKENYPKVEVIYTRKNDTFIPLNVRSDIANKAGADLFISIHVDATINQTANGVGTFIMGIDKSNGNLDVAMRENDVITYESDYSAKYSGYSPGSSESFIIFTLMQYSFLEQSMSFAQMVQTELVKNTGLNNRGTRQAGFLVLWQTTMPSILVELGFITNPSDKKFLTSKAGQEKYARSLFNAFSRYKTEADGRGNTIVLGGGGSDNNKIITPEAVAAPEPKKEISKNQIIYRIQVCSSAQKIPLNSSRFGSYKNKVKEIKIGNLYKYYVEQTDSYNKALSLQRKVRTSFSDAFMVAFNGSQVITTSQARKTNP